MKAYKIIKNEAEYDEYLKLIEALMEKDPLSKSESDELELLAKLVEDYEEEKYPMDMPSPVEAIKFRMEQEGLKAKDLVQYIGSRSKVSEVLSGRRPLSLNMIRSLNSGLGIPAEILLKKKDAELPSSSKIDWNRFPISEMFKRGWFENFSGSLLEAKDQAEELISSLILSSGEKLLPPALCRQSVQAGKGMDEYSLAAWRIRVCKLAHDEELPKYKRKTIDEKFMNELTNLSYLGNGPLLAREFLNKNGIHLIVEEHLPKTYLDGAAMMLSDGSPLIALTIRHDRLDNFWFTLCHELAHLTLHLENDCGKPFFDDLDTKSTSKIETEADAWARNSLIPDSIWKKSGLSESSKAAEVIEFANKRRIHPSIPAGRIRRETSNYKVFSKLLGNGEVESLFTVA
jgi:HTH-type transcriptional regulator/antitoxin HigA